MKTDFITVEEYIDGGGKLAPSTSIYDSKQEFLGWFQSHSDDYPMIVVKIAHGGSIQQFHRYELCVLVQVKPIFDAL
jgi:hypothetical protein